MLFDFVVLYKPEQINPEQAAEIIDTRQPLGLFFLKEGDWYVGIDNQTGDAWTEDFQTQEECLHWLLQED